MELAPCLLGVFAFLHLENGFAAAIGGGVLEHVIIALVKLIFLGINHLVKVE